MLQLVMNSLAKSTRKAYARAWEEFLGSRARRRVRQEEVVEDVVQFIMGLIEKGQTRVTIAGKLAALGFMGKLLWGYLPSAGELGQKILNGWARELGVTGRVRHPISVALLKLLFPVLGDVCHDARKAMLFLTFMSWLFFGAFRVSELLGLPGHSGILWSEVQPGEEGVVVVIRKSKTDQKGVGATVLLRRYPARSICPGLLERRLRMEKGPLDGPVFCHAEGFRVTASQLLGVLRRGLSRLGLDASRFGTHSFRIGVATEAGNKGWGREELKALGRWRSD
ncbi:integrase/recombinase xerD homolog [Pleurodeles waltl]|uniref:integrase/recombinase xerD homolog n=1 Tax=Pleurodeles waltl TaxID=8319 RepID=UPI0037099336